ncbi:hypothetical protein BP5796_11212 [Coleophoma crateriformis]|uniref:Uncharacterized protein n=1 Tax=Coleophoma crateriformis TaxID=565419 RepID=A0A3D8QI29_9HELO|nr:hypothetical protein BP5796_11212 [Coleophoma crateriformis]
MFRNSSKTGRRSVDSAGRRPSSRSNSIFSHLSIRSTDGEQQPGHYVVVYDPLEKKIYLEEPQNVNDKKFVKVDVKGTQMIVDLKAPMGPEGRKVDMKIATIDLGLLGKSLKKQRKSGKINHVYILGRLPGGFENIDEVIQED